MPKSRTRKPPNRAATRAAARPAPRAWEDVPLIAQPPARPAPPSPAPAAPASPLDPLRDLQRVAHDLEAVTARRARLLERRAALVADLRASGVSWATLTAITGTSRQGLVKGGGPAL